MSKIKKIPLAAQLPTEGPTQGQQRIARRVQRYDQLMRKQQPLTKEDAALVKGPPTKRERKIDRALRHQVNSVRKEARKTNRGNVEALLDATKSSRPLTETDQLQFCGNVTIQSEDEAVRTANEAFAAPFDPKHRVLFVSGTSVKVGKCKQFEPRTKSAGAAVICKMVSGDNNNADHTWEKKPFGLGPTNQGIEAGLRSIAEALALVAIQMASAKNDEMPSNDRPPKQSKATIFTDSRAAVSKVSNIKLTARQLESTPSLEKLITRSEFLRHLGVDVDLRWSPRRHSQGTRRAEVTARKAAGSHGACKCGDSLDDGLQILIDSLKRQ